MILHIIFKWNWHVILGKHKEESNLNNLDLWHFNVYQNKFLFILLFFCLPCPIHLFLQINLNLKIFWILPPLSIAGIFIGFALNLWIQETWHFIMSFLIEELVFFHIHVCHTFFVKIYLQVFYILLLGKPSFSYSMGT